MAFDEVDGFCVTHPVSELHWPLQRSSWVARVRATLLAARADQLRLGVVSSPQQLSECPRGLLQASVRNLVYD
jgi:hypothetical protein